MNLFNAQGWATHGNVVDSGSLRTVPIEGSFSANTNGRLEYYYDGVSPAGDTLTGHVSYTITNADGDVWFIVMPDGSGGQYNKQLAHQGDAVPITGSFDLAVQIPEGSSFVEVGTYNQQYATSEGPAPSGYGSMGSVVVPAPLPLPVAPDESLTAIEGAPVSVAPVITQGGNPVTPDSLAVVDQPIHGAASVDGVSLVYAPMPGYFGADSFVYLATVGGVESNDATVSVDVTPVACDEIGRVTRIYASGYDRARVHDGRLVRGESRCLVVDFDGAIPPARTVTSVTWRCSDSSVIAMSGARIQPDGRSVAVNVQANYPCDAAIKCEATLDNGEVYAQLIRLAVVDSPWFCGETTGSAGPTALTSP